MKERFLNLTSQLQKLIRSNKKYKKVIILSISISIPLVFFVITFLTSPKPFRFLIGNIGEKTFTVAFITYKPIKACIMVTQVKQLSNLKIKCDLQKTNLHLINFSNLIPAASYKVRYFSGMKTNFFEPLVISTNSIAETPPGLPEPGYGSVVDENLTPLPNSLVVIYPQSGLNKALITKTNLQGNYSIDIGSIFYEGEQIYIEATTLDSLWGGVKIQRDIHTPFPSIQVKGLVKLE